MSASITISFTVTSGYNLGDYVQLHGNGGSGSVDWDTPLTEKQYNLFPNGAGRFGWGHFPWGHAPWGHGQSLRTAGWGHLPWGHFPWGHGATIIEASTIVTGCGSYIFGFKGYDQAGNAHTGTPDEITVPVHIAPAQPTPLEFNSYNKTTNILTLDAA